MSGKMKWDRVQVESRAHSHGSEWINSDSRILTSSGQLAPVAKAKNKSRSTFRSTSKSFSPMVGCTCQKSTGFTGQHKQKCPLNRKNRGIAKPWSVAALRQSPRHVPPKPSTGEASAASLTLSDLVIRLNRVNLDVDLKRFLVAAQRWLAEDRESPPIDKQLAAEAVRSLLAAIAKYR
jgi:hypothetical protein